MLPEDNELPKRTYEAKKILCSIGMDYERIHACPNDCILYRKDYEDLDSCPVCGMPRYKLSRDNSKRKKGIPAKVLWYLPVIPRFKRMFNNAEHAKSLRWHSEGRIEDDMLRHPADSPQWNMINSKFPDFGCDARNLRLGLSTDGMNPHGNMSSAHSTWPVILTIYNLPPWLCMKRRFLMMTLLISGPKQPGNDIDIFLAPLIDDLKLLWEEGVEVFDAHRHEFFRLRALLLWTVNDFPAYGNLAGYSVKGHKACPICAENTCSQQLKHGRKTVYLGTRRFLPLSHRYRRLRKAFDGSTEEGRAPKPMTGEAIYQRVKDIPVSYGKGKQKGVDKNIWKKRSIFFDLPYWKDLYVRHCIDLMHNEKNICDSIIGTLLNIPGKTKDGINARLDLVEMGLREGLAPVQRGQNTYLPPACHTLSRKEKIELCECLAGIKVPSGYSSNIRSLVSMKDLKLVGLKSHDCHALMQQLLPIAIRSILPKHVRHAIIRLCFFFNAICSKVIDPEKLEELQKEIVVTLCQLEMYFPPSFFDIMVHLTVHLVREIKLCGPVYLRWMYPFERYMKILKGYVRNRNRPEGCIVECYIAEEAVEFCSEYLSSAETIGLPKPIYSKKDGTGTCGQKVVTISHDLIVQAHKYVLNNTDEVQPYIDEHLEHLRHINPSKAKREKWVIDEHNKIFINWFRNRIDAELVKSPDTISQTLRWVAKGPRLDVLSYNGYVTNGYCFYTKAHDDRCTVQNSGVTLVAQAVHISSAKDKNPKFASMSYYGVIQDIWELDYVMLRIPVFRCKWVESNTGVKKDDLGFTLVDLNKEGHKGDTFILASQAKQIFYITDPADKKWSIVLSMKQNIFPGCDDEYDTGENIEEISSFSVGLPNGGNDDDNLVEDMICVRDDHLEGLLIEDSNKKRKK